MVILRTYWSPAETALAKSVLDNCEISCALLDEHSSVYSRGGQFAVPIRLAVDERDIDRAIWVLNGDLDKAIELIAPDPANERPMEHSLPMKRPIEIRGSCWCSRFIYWCRRFV